MSFIRRGVSGVNSDAYHVGSPSRRPPSKEASKNSVFFIYKWPDSTIKLYISKTGN